MKRPTDSDALRDLLRRADPVRHQSPLSGVELRRLRARIDSVPASIRLPDWRPLLAMGVTALAVITTIVWRPQPAPPSMVTPEGLSAVAARGTSLGARTTLSPRHPTERRADPTDLTRELHFTAPNGTRIVWNLRHAHDAGLSEDAEVRS